MTRRAWLEWRLDLERRLRVERLCSTPDGQRPVNRLYGHDAKMALGFKLSGLYAMGRRNAGRPALRRLDLVAPGLPAAFDGFTILFLSDLHVGIPAGAVERGRELVASVECDVAVFGGDYQSYGRPAAAVVAQAMAPLVGAIKARQGIYGVLGNHDSADLVAPLEEIGIRLLINESIRLNRRGEHVTLVGCDDVHVFYHHAALEALGAEGGFRIAAVHSPDFAPEAAAAGCSVYLAGHTHGGQVCLPGGRPVMTGLYRERRRAKGIWHVGEMVGYTSTGLGCGGVPVRLNCPPEIVLITLRCPQP